jgi:hypothetical protein
MLNQTDGQWTRRPYCGAEVVGATYGVFRPSRQMRRDRDWRNARRPRLIASEETTGAATNSGGGRVTLRQKQTNAETDSLLKSDSTSGFHWLHLVLASRRCTGKIPCNSLSRVCLKYGRELRHMPLLQDN